MHVLNQYHDKLEHTQAFDTVDTPGEFLLRPLQSPDQSLRGQLALRLQLDSIRDDDPLGLPPNKQGQTAWPA